MKPAVLINLLLLFAADSFFLVTKQTPSRYPLHLGSSKSEAPTTVPSIEKATQLLSEWDRSYNAENINPTSTDFDRSEARPLLPGAIKCLSEAARKERTLDSTKGRCMLGICASSAEEGLETLKSWVNELELPRGLLHGMDKDGVPLKLEGAVYIKYNTGGSLSFSDIRKSGVGFDALWKPGDALLEPYDGTYRGVYFQTELSDGEFRQFLVPLDIFE